MTTPSKPQLRPSTPLSAVSAGDEQLFARYFEGSISPAEAKDLAAALRVDRAYAKAFADYARRTQALATVAHQQALVANTAAKTIAGPGSAAWASAAMAMAATLALTLLGVLIATQQAGPEQGLAQVGMPKAQGPAAMRLSPPSEPGSMTMAIDSRQGRQVTLRMNLD